jgi:hypothetical protein
MMKRKRSKRNVGDEEREERKGREREGKWEGKKEGRDCGLIGNPYRQLHGTTEENKALLPAYRLIFTIRTLPYTRSDCYHCTATGSSANLTSNNQHKNNKVTGKAK